MGADNGSVAISVVATPGSIPTRVLLRQLQRKIADLPADRRSARSPRTGPLAGYQTAVPGQQRPRRDQPTAAKRGGQQPGKGCQDHPVGLVRPGPGHLAAQHHHLMPQHTDLRVLRRLAAAQ